MAIVVPLKVHTRPTNFNFLISEIWSCKAEGIPRMCCWLEKPFSSL